MSKTKKILNYLFLLIVIGLIYTSYNTMLNYYNVGPNEFIFHLHNQMDNGFSLIIAGILPMVIFTIIVSALILWLFKHIKPITKKIITIDLLIFLILSFIINQKIYILGLEYFSKSNIIKNHYVETKLDNINFNDKKNLIMIHVESLETNILHKEYGGKENRHIVPNLENILSDGNTLNFSNNNSYGGLIPLYGSSWTTSSLVANTSGLPIKVSYNFIYENEHNRIFNNQVTLYDVLKYNNYYTEVISASPTTFGGVKEYLNNRNIDKIIDKSNANQYLSINKQDINTEWGLNDRYIFNLAKKRLNSINTKEPFFLTILTIDTHEGDYINKELEQPFNDRSFDVFYDTDKLIGDFINWLKEQDYYKDTVIYIYGDHPSIDSSIMWKYGNKNRTTYNAILNSNQICPNNKHRLASNFDMFPTIIYNIGGNIKDNQLGLGVNLCSDNNTLLETYNIDYVNKELKKGSKFYNKRIAK